MTRPPDPTDAQLVAQIRAGSEAAARSLVERYQRPVFSIAFQIVRDSTLAEDLAQEAFVRAFRYLHTFNPAYPFSSWIFRITHNVSVDALRARKLETVSLDAQRGEEGDGLSAVLPDPAQPPPSQAVERANLAGALDRAMARLRPEYREVLLLRFHHDLSYQEIAEITGLPLGTVKTHLHRARKEMAHLMRQAGFGPEESETRREPPP